jgi:DtxR family manganese transport transcriptional regulator
MILTLPYQPLVLTDAGRNVAARHVLLRDFLKSLGVNAETAEADAEVIEKHVSEQSLAAFAKFIK